jgi:y4mF family transcriptional regulator
MTIVRETTASIALALGARIHDRRKELHTTQEDLAALAGVSSRFLGELERGKPTVRLDSMLAVCEALGLSVTLT